MLNKKTILKGIILGWVSSACLMAGFIATAQSSVIPVADQQTSYSPVLTVSMALLLTILTVFVINLLARYLRETTGDSYGGFEDPDH
jgi:hypothetical protein